MTTRVKGGSLAVAAVKSHCQFIGLADKSNVSHTCLAWWRLANSIGMYIEEVFFLSNHLRTIRISWTRTSSSSRQIPRSASCSFTKKNTFDFDNAGAMGQSDIPTQMLHPSTRVAPRFVRQVLPGMIILLNSHFTRRSFAEAAKINPHFAME